MERQYIGARYVPKFWDNGSGSTEWVPNIPYESMVVVTYMNNSYTSKIPVPATQIAPNVDTEHWALTGAYNAQVEQYRQETIGYRDRVDALMSRIVDVKDMGAVGDGVTDDSAAFKRAVSGGNKTVYVPAGNYKIGSHIELDNNTYIVGNGTIISAFTPASVGASRYDGLFYAVDKERICVDGLKFIGRGATTGNYDSGNILFFLSCEGVCVTNCHIKETKGVGSICFESCKHFSATKNNIDRYTYAGIVVVQGGENYDISYNVVNESVSTAYGNTYPISLASAYDDLPHTAKNVTCCGNVITESRAYWEGIDAHYGDYFTISNNIIKGTRSGITLVGNAAEHPTKHKCITISNNIIELGTDNSGSGLNSGIVCYARDATITGNLVKNSGVLASNEFGVYGTLINSLICDNIFDNCGGNGVGDVLENTKICSNTFIANGSKSNSIVIEARATSKNISVSDNKCTGWDYLYFMQDTNIDRLNPMVIGWNDTNTQLNTSGRQMVVPYATNAIPSAVGITAGRKGDIVYNINCAAGSPIGWICVESATADSNSVWATMPNLV